MAATLKETFGIEADLIEGSNGIFDVSADGAMVFSKHDAGRFPEHDEVIDTLRALGATSTHP